MTRLPEWTKTREMRAIAAMCMAMFLFVGNDIFNKLAREHWPTGQVLAVCAGDGGWPAPALGLAERASAPHSGHAASLRAAPGRLEGLVAAAFITVLGLIPLSDALAILMASTLIGTALSVPLLGETVGWRRWTAILIGFTGMLLVVRPEGGSMNWGGLLAVACAIGVAFRDISTRFIPKDVPSIVITLATAIGAWLGGIALLPFEQAQPFDAHVMLYLLCSAC